MDREWRVKGMEKRKGEVGEEKGEERKRVEINRREWIKKDCVERRERERGREGRREGRGVGERRKM